MFDKYLKDDVLFVVPYEVRTQLLKHLAKQKEIYRITFLSLEEFKEHYFYAIKKEEALAFLYEKTHLKISILKEKLALLYQIDPKKKYRSKKLNELVSLYYLLDEQGFIVKDLAFQKYLKSFQICVMGYPYLDAYEENMFDSCHAEKIPFSSPYTLPPVYSFQTVEEELAAVAGRIRELHEQGIPYNKIRLTGISSDYTYLLERIFSLFKIPYVGSERHSLFATEIAKDYLNSMDSSTIKDTTFRKKIVSIENRLLHISKESEAYPVLLKEKLKTTYLDEVKYQDAVSIIDFYHLIPEEDTYTFVLGFNQNALPKVFKDEEYLSDEEKKELASDTSITKNKKYKQMTVSLLKSLANLWISYKESSLSNHFFPSSSILEESLVVENYSKQSYVYSQTYSSICLGEMLDTFLIYGEKHPDLEKLLVSFQDFPYRSYQHAYKKIPLYLDPEKPFYLSYSSLNDYALCKFKYYSKYILKLEKSEQTFPTVLGNIYHDVLSHMYDASFDFESSWEKALSKYTLTKKEQILLRRLKKELAFIIPVIEEQDSKSAFSKRLFEQKIELPLGDNVVLKGFVDKISFCELYGKIHYVIYDYKTGSVTLDLTHIDDGLFLQLPVYQVLVEKGKLLPNPHFTGFFYQQLLRPSKDQQEKINHLKLRGYVVDDEEALSIFDETYEQSEVVQGLKMTASGFSKSSKVLSCEDASSMVDRTYQKILEMKTGILKGDFEINPKRLKKENISCKYCSFRDVCFHDEKDIVEIHMKEEV